MFRANVTQWSDAELETAYVDLNGAARVLKLLGEYGLATLLISRRAMIAAELTQRAQQAAVNDRQLSLVPPGAYDRG